MKINGEKIVKAVKGAGLIALGFLTGVAYTGVQVAKAMTAAATAAAMKLNENADTEGKEEEETTEEQKEDDAE